MGEKYILYGCEITRDVVVRMVMDEGGIPYEFRRVDVPAGEQHSAGFLQINPAGVVPALLTPDGQALFENAAILLYLIEKHELTDFMPWPGDPDRGQFLSQLFFQTNELQAAFKRWFYPHRFSSERAADSKNIRAAAYANLLELWQRVDDKLAGNGPFHLGARLSLLDFHMAVWATYGLRTVDETVERFPAVAKVVDNIRDRPKSGHHLERLQVAVNSLRE